MVGVGVDRLSDRGDIARPDRPRPTTPTGATPCSPRPVTAGPYTFPAIPQGWEVQGAGPSVVTIAPVGFPDQEPLSFPGKLVIGYDQNPPSGERVERDGRTFWVNARRRHRDHRRPHRVDEPDGEVTIQYPTSTGWTVDDMIAFLAGVHVGPGAEPGLG